jgi:hypothetical protein
MLNIISLGAGVQSSTMALMAAAGEITPMPDCAIFADTGAEPRKVYEWLTWLETLLPFPVHRVSRGNLRTQIVDSMAGLGKMNGRPPFFTQSGGMLRRQCTHDFKLLPLHAKVRELVGLKPRQRAPKEVQAVQWIGISTDEAARQKPSIHSFVTHRWPLIEVNMSRTDCLHKFDKAGLPRPPKSACTFCPYHDNAMWRDMKENDPQSFADAVLIDETVRPGIGQRNKEPWFLHRSRKPLSEVDFRTAKDAGQQSMFDDECEGMCGV